jgi:hypothetical protein
MRQRVVNVPFEQNGWVDVGFCQGCIDVVAVNRHSLGGYMPVELFDLADRAIVESW